MSLGHPDQVLEPKSIKEGLRKPDTTREPRSDQHIGQVMLEQPYLLSYTVGIGYRRLTSILRWPKCIFLG